MIHTAVQAATGATGVWAETLAWDGVTGSAEDARKQATKKGAGLIVNQMCMPPPSPFASAQTPPRALRPRFSTRFPIQPLEP